MFPNENVSGALLIMDDISEISSTKTSSKLTIFPSSPVASLIIFSVIVIDGDVVSTTLTIC